MDHYPSSEDAAQAPFNVPPSIRAPLVPEALLRQHDCLVSGDTRFRTAARLRQSIWREEQGLPAGLHRPGGNRTITPIRLGSLLQPADAARGLNFLSPTVHGFVRRSLVLREEGAMVNYDRLTRNLLSSEPLTYSLLIPLALNLELATAIFRQLLPTFVHQVTAIRFETSPGRYDPRYLADGTAFDAALSVITPDGEPATLFIEVKYSEGCTGPAATLRRRYDEASREAALHLDPDAPALRSVMLEQFWRLHLLAQLAVRHKVTPRAHLLVLYPHHNRRVRTATRLYAAELADPAGSSPTTAGFTALTLETFVAELAQAGGGAEAAYLHHRYLDLTLVLNLVLSGAVPSDDPPPSATPPLALPPPKSALEEAATASSIIVNANMALTTSPPRPSARRCSQPSATTQPKQQPAGTPSSRSKRRRSISSGDTPIPAASEER